jgi:hypothetical protein
LQVICNGGEGDRVMPTTFFIVLFARERWWLDRDGAAKGPFDSLEAAMAEAVADAAATARQGGRSEVRVMGPGHDNKLIYQSADRSLLGRAVAEARS